MPEERVSVRQDGHLLSWPQARFLKGISLCACAKQEVPNRMLFNLFSKKFNRKLRLPDDTSQGSDWDFF